MLTQSAFHRATLSTGDLIAADVAVSATQFTEIGRRTIPAGIGEALGYSSLEGQDSAAGRLFADVRDNTAAPGVVLNGVLRLDIHDPEDHVVRTLWEGRTEKLRATAADPGTHLPLPLIGDGIGESWSLVAKFRADAAGSTMGKTNTTLLVDITRYTVRVA